MGGLFACSAAFNTLLSPLHFCGAVGMAHTLERYASRVWRDHAPEERTQRCEPVESTSFAAPGESSAESGITTVQDELTEADFRRNLLFNVAFVGTLFDLMFAAYLA